MIHVATFIQLALLGSSCGQAGNTLCTPGVIGIHRPDPCERFAISTNLCWLNVGYALLYIYLSCGLLTNTEAPVMPAM